MGRIVNRAQFAEIIGKSPRTVGEMIAQGLPASRTGKKGAEVQIDTEAAITWLISREVAKRVPDLDETEPRSREAEEYLLIKAKRIHQDLVNAEKEQQLANLDEMQQAASAAMILIGSQLDGLAGRLATPLANLDDPAEIRELLLDECRRIRSAAANRLQDFFTVDRSGELAAPATEADAVAMGGD